MATVAELKALRMEPGDQRNLGPDEELVLRVKSVKNWFGKDKDHCGLTLEDASGEWIPATVFGAPSEIAKMEGEWIPVRPSAGSKSGVWVECREFTPRQGPSAGKTIRKNELKIMSNCFRWDQSTTSPPGPPQRSSPPQTASGGSSAGGAMTDREWVVWASAISGELHEIYSGMLRGQGDPALESDVIAAVQATLVHLSIRHEKGSLRLTYGQQEDAGTGGSGADGFEGSDDDDIPF